MLGREPIGETLFPDFGRALGNPTSQQQQQQAWQAQNGGLIKKVSGVPTDRDVMLVAHLQLVKGGGRDVEFCTLSVTKLSTAKLWKECASF